jgi:hypothetical protein
VIASPTPLSDAELAEWVTNELRKDDLRALERLQATRVKAWADKDAQQGARAKAIMAGQQAIRRDLPHLVLGGSFSAAPAPQGGWVVRYSVDRADGMRSAPFRGRRMRSCSGRRRVRAKVSRFDHSSRAAFCRAMIPLRLRGCAGARA